MKRVYKYLFVFLGSLFMFPLVSNAACSYERQAELSKIASNVQFSYTYDIVNGDPQFIVNIVNLTNDIYIISDYKNDIINGTGERNIQYNYVSKESFNIYSNDPACRGEFLLTKYVNMSSYNEYSQSEECKQNPDFKYCQVWGTKPYTKEEFNEELIDYKNLKNSINQTGEKTMWQIFAEFIEKNKVIIGIIGLCLMILIVSIILYKKHDSRR